jgi:hypothetical protein
MPKTPARSRAKRLLPLRVTKMVTKKKRKRRRRKKKRGKKEGMVKTRKEKRGETMNRPRMRTNPMSVLFFPPRHSHP